MRMRTLAIVLLALAAGGCKNTDQTHERATSQQPVANPATGTMDTTLTIKGTLTDEGVECPAMRDEAGTLYTLSGSLGAFKPGNQVCVKGTRAEMSTCQQGITINVAWIGPASECP